MLQLQNKFSTIMNAAITAQKMASADDSNANLSSVTTSITPNIDGVYNLGTSDSRWNNLNLKGNLTLNGKHSVLTANDITTRTITSNNNLYVNSADIIYLERPTSIIHVTQNIVSGEVYNVSTLNSGTIYFVKNIIDPVDFYLPNSASILCTGVTYKIIVGPDNSATINLYTADLDRLFIFIKRDDSHVIVSSVNEYVLDINHYAVGSYIEITLIDENYWHVCVTRD